MATPMAKSRTRSWSRKYDDDSWTSVDHQELDMATTYISDNMYLVMEDPTTSLYAGESVHFKAYALCDKSTTGLVGVSAAPRASHHGTLFLTSQRLLFLSFHKGEENEQVQELVSINLHAIAEMAEITPSISTSGDGSLSIQSQLEVSCKNFEIIRFNFPSESASSEVYVQVNQILHTSQPETAFVFPQSQQLPDVDGWSLFDAQAEFARLNLRNSSTSLGGFRLSSANEHYRLCSTYPSSIVVPTAVNDGELRKIAQFRARGRVPAVTYRHINNAIIARCAQPLVGIRRRRCTQDEALIKALRSATGKLVFVDCRSQTSAYGNVALGGGFESLDYYKNTSMMFMGIENIHSMRDSLRKLFDLVKYEVRGQERAKWWSCLESTRWLEHVRSVLVASSNCVSKVAEEQSSLVIHCSDGWDRTAQIVALTKLCLDPYYRTLKGFQVLVEQEWLAFGYQFRSRSGLTDENGAYWEDERSSPVFMQFIDAVWQLMRQFPCSFEFNERFLIALLDEVYAKQSATFLYDCEQARVHAKVHSRCLTAWTLLRAHPQAAEFYNPFFILPVDDDNGSDRSPRVLQYKWHTSFLAIWTTFYLRSLESNDSRVSQDAWAKEVQVNQRQLQDQLQSATQKLASQVEYNSNLESELETLREESAKLRSALENQVFTDDSKGMFVHEQDGEEDDGVLVSVTPVPKSDSSRQNLGASGSVGGFLGGTIASNFEILQSYFDPMTRLEEDTSPSSSKSVSSSSSSSKCTTEVANCERSVSMEEVVR